MSERPRLPDFDRPPLAEVALSVQFESLESLRAAHLGLLWSEYRDRLPRLEEHTPIPHVIEELEPKLLVPSGVEVESLDSPPVPRAWYLNHQGTELIQVQDTRFVRNWRKTGSDTDYPRYEHIREGFAQELQVFLRFLQKEGLGQPAFDQCEVTYVNHIVAGDGWQDHGEVSEVVKLWSPRQEGDYLPRTEAVNFAARYLMPKPDRPEGRLHVTVNSAFRIPDGKPLLILTLIARGKPRGNAVEDVLTFMDTGRAWIVEAFTSITTAKMHRIWERRDGPYER